MWYIILASVVLLFFILVGCKEGETKVPKSSKNEPTQTIIVGKPSTIEFSREEITKKLAELAKSPPPANLKTMGAMCYDMAGPSPNAEYVCVTCGEKTVYSDYMTASVEWGIPACRRLIKDLESYPIRLDESEFCRKCSPEIKSPEIALIVQYKGENTKNRIRGIKQEDIKLMYEFLSGKNIHRTWNDAEEPLQKHIARLKELLNIGK